MENLEEDASYTCPSCSEQIVIPLDPTAGAVQEYVEDCPVCCSPIVLRVSFGPSGEVSVSAKAE